MKRKILYFVRGVENNIKWESSIKHDLKEGAEAELDIWRKMGKTGEIKIMREIIVCSIDKF